MLLGHLVLSHRPIVSCRLSTKQEIWKPVLPCNGKVHQLLSSVSCRMSGRLYHESGTLKIHVTFRQAHQLFLCGSCMSSSSSSPSKSSFLPKCLTNSIRSLFNVHHPLKVDWCHQEQMYFIVMKSLNVLKHFKCHILKVSERFEESLLEIHLCTSRKPN